MTTKYPKEYIETFTIEERAFGSKIRNEYFSVTYLPNFKDYEGGVIRINLPSDIENHRLPRLISGEQFAELLEKMV